MARAPTPESCERSEAISTTSTGGMNFLNPLGLALGTTLPIIVIFYLLKVRRHNEEVSSTFLWHDLIRDVAAHEPLQRLKWSVLLLLQLFALALITVAVARPFSEQIGQKPIQAILVLDASASMQANDVQPSRFDRAVQDARRTVASLPENSVATLIVVTAHPQVLVAATADRQQVDRVLANARPSSAVENMQEALLLARSLGGDPNSRRIYVFTDGAFTLSPDLPEDLGPVEVDKVGMNAANLAVTVVSARPDLQDNRRQQVFARTQNFSDSPAHAVLTMSADGEEIERRPVDLAPNGTSEQVFNDLPPGARWASVSITAVDAEDNLPLDDSAFAALANRKAAQVLLVTRGDSFLEKVLTLLPNVELYRISVERYLSVEADRFDIVVFDNYLPPLLPPGNLLVIDPPSRGAYPAIGSADRPRVATWDHEDPILDFVDVRDLTVQRAVKLEVPHWAKALISAEDGTPLLLVGQDGEHKVAILPFELQQSNLPLIPAFPILMANLANYLSPPGVVQSAQIQPDDPESLSPSPQVQTVRVIGPSGHGSDLGTGQGPLTYAATDEPGLYSVQQFAAEGQQIPGDDFFAVNLSSPEESDLRPRLTGLANPGEPDAGSTMLRKEYWGVLSAALLPLLLFEWFWFHRRT
ncbi:MAG: BatA and WFA domain-containing protein [Chloroflexi bacterium]|nr:BatA and WFA domain-containing protein [Chloroflexota bacterium]